MIPLNGYPVMYHQYIKPTHECNVSEWICNQHLTMEIMKTHTRLSGNWGINYDAR